MSLLATIFTAIPMMLIMAVSLPLLITEMGIEIIPALFDPDLYADLLSEISQRDFGEIIEIIKEAIRIHMEWMWIDKPKHNEISLNVNFNLYNS